MSTLTVSIAMVIRNADRFLAEAIESILGQTFAEYEFIIVDYGSSDKSRSVVSSYAKHDRRIKFHVTANCSLAEARNSACLLAQGRYVAIMDADDVSLRDRLMWEVDFMEKHPKVGIVGGATEWIDATGRSLCVNHFPIHDHEIRSSFGKVLAFCQPTVLIRREAFVQVGGYRAVFAQAEDYDLWLRIAEHFQCANLRQVVLKYRIHPHQVSLRKRTQQTLCTLAAEISASSRQNGDVDPLNTVKEITPSVLAGFGVSEATQRAAVASEYAFWIRTMCTAGEYSAALNAATEVLESPDWKYAGRVTTANVRLLMARAYWKQKRFMKGVVTMSHALMTRPILVGRPLKLLLRWLHVQISGSQKSYSA
jgi:hypothetical protein